MEDKCQEALNYMFGCAMTKDDITDYEEKRMIECSDIIKKAIDRNEVLEKALYKACSIINKQFNGCYHCENKRCTAEINKVDDCGIEKLEEYLLKESEKEKWIMK